MTAPHVITATAEKTDRVLPPWLTIVDDRLQIVGDARACLNDDPSRLLAIAVITAETGLRAGHELRKAANGKFDRIHTVDRSLWRHHFNNLLVTTKPSLGLRFLLSVKVLPQLLPEVSAMVGFHKSCPVHHKDIWDHTLQVVDKCPAQLVVRWTALMHDVGKVWTRTVNSNRRVHFFRHEELGASLMRGVAARFELEPELGDRIVYVIGNHARANVYAENWTDSAVRRLIRDMGDYLDDVIAFSQSDFTTKRPERIREVQTLAAQLNDRIARVKELDAKVEPLPKGFGNLVMQKTGRRGGPWLGRIQRWLKDEVDAGRVQAELDAETYFAFVRSNAPDMLAAE